MGKIRKKLKKIRIHHEGTNTLWYSAIVLTLIALILWFTIPSKVPFGIFVVVFGTIFGIVLNFYRCPIRYFESEDTEGIVVAPADGTFCMLLKDKTESANKCVKRVASIGLFMPQMVAYSLFR